MAGPVRLPRCLAGALVVAGCAVPQAPPAALPPPPAPSCPGPWTCEQQAHFAAVHQLVVHVPGAQAHLAVVVTDRESGATWTAGDADRPGWTASTIKLAIAADLLARDRSGTISLSSADRHDIATMLNFSDEAASDRLWRAYGGDAMLDRFRTDYGMRTLAFVPGFTRTTYWGFLKTSTADLATLARHVLDGDYPGADPRDRTLLVAALRGVATNQQWGVWAAGADQRPGVKDGWSFEADAYGRHWVTDTVGFAGPAERYVVAVGYQVDPAGSLADGVHTVSDAVALLFGRPVPAPVVVPEPDG
ncbi:tat pathway signal sequence [Pseudonocardia sp. CA-107938]|uniref:tat pathway signal sequence n=1 Tax=Pseudonocardia sp. CA-107938 TaxID=3240021 RepID=UPI003D92E41F